MTERGPIDVIVAAYRDGATIRQAITSALTEPEVGRVIVVDDHSDDDTVAQSRLADDGSGRLTILRQERNCGPAAARNRALAESRSPLVAILDGDDYFLPGRFAALLSHRDWDVVADNIAFVAEGAGAVEVERSPVEGPATALTLQSFVDGNISRPGHSRRELGFLKPVLRRAFLVEKGLSYDPALRLGEDFDFYARLLGQGARFLRVESCGYVARVRAGSLSGRHGEAELAALLEAVEQIAARPDLSDAERRAFRRYLAQLRLKVHHRRVLTARQANILAGVREMLMHPALLPRLALAILRDKLASPVAPDPRKVRYLLSH